MKRNFLKILLASLVLMIALGAVSALEDTATDDVVSAEESEVVSVSQDDAVAVDESEAVAAENDGDVLTAENDEGEILAAESDEQVLTATEGDSEKLASASGDDILAGTGSVVFKTFKFGTIKLPKKYMGKDFSDMPKKVQKSFKKQYKKVVKNIKKKSKKLKDWYTNEKLKYNPTVKGKYVYVTVTLRCFKYVY